MTGLIACIVTSYMFTLCDDHSYNVRPCGQAENQVVFQQTRGFRPTGVKVTVDIAPGCGWIGFKFL
jgi:hypothetical protein